MAPGQGCLLYMEEVSGDQAENKTLGEEGTVVLQNTKLAGTVLLSPCCVTAPGCHPRAAYSHSCLHPRDSPSSSHQPQL